MTDDHLDASEMGAPPIINFGGDFVLLGPLRRDLVPTYQRWVNDFATMRNLGVVLAPMTFEGETRWYDGIAQDSREIQFTIYERATMRPIGNTGFHSVDYRHKTAEFGILIGEADARGRGYGSEATRLMLDYAFTALGLNNVMLRVMNYNLAGQRAYEKAGFRLFGRRREAIRLAGRSWDVLYMEALAVEFSGSVLANIFAPDVERSRSRTP